MKRKKFLCPFCKKELRKVGLKNIQSGEMVYNCDIINDKGRIGNWEEDEFETNESGTFFCGNCHNELDIEKLKLFIF